MMSPKSLQLFAWSLTGYAILMSQISFCASQNLYYALSKAVRSGNTERVQELLNQGANPNQTDVYGSPLLTHVSCLGKKEIVHILLNHGADPNQADSHDGTPLQYVAFANPLLYPNYANNKDIIQYLLNHGADPNLKDKIGKTALSYAVDSGQEEIIRMLLKAGAQIDDWFYKLSWKEQAIIHKHRHIIGKRKDTINDSFNTHAGENFPNVLRDLVEQFEGTYSKKRPQHIRPTKRQRRK